MSDWGNPASDPISDIKEWVELFRQRSAIPQPDFRRALNRAIELHSDEPHVCTLGEMQALLNQAISEQHLERFAAPYDNANPCLRCGMEIERQDLTMQGRRGAWVHCETKRRMCMPPYNEFFAEPFTSRE